MTFVALFAICLASFWTTLSLMVLLTAYYRRWRQSRNNGKQHTESGSRVRCLLIRPCSGDDGGLLFNCLTAITNVPPKTDIELIIGVDSTNDPAHPIAIKAASQLNDSGIPTQVHVAPIIGPNRKVSILAGCLATARRIPDVVISADSSVVLDHFDLQEFIAPLISTKNVGAIWSPMTTHSSYRGAGNVASKAVLHSSWHSFGLLSAIDPAGMMGKLFAIRFDALTHIGGFESMVRHLGEDMEISKRLREQKRTVLCSTQIVRTISGKLSWNDTVSRHARWIMVIKSQRRRLMISYPFLFFHTFFVYALSALGCICFPIAGTVTGMAAFTLRILVGYSAGRMVNMTPTISQVIVQSLVADIVLILAFFRALTMRTVTWRGITFAFTQKGELVTVSAQK